MSLEEEYKRSTKWLGPLFALALVAVLLLVFCGQGPVEGQTPDIAPSTTGEDHP